MPELFADRKLLAAFRAGQSDALTRVYESYAPAVGSFLSSLGVRCRADLEDMVHETFIRAFSEQARLDFDGVRPYEPFLLTIARNLLLDSRRRQTAAPTEPDELSTLEEKRAPPAPDPGRVAECRELEHLLTQLVAGLEPLERRLLELRYEQHLGQEQTAQHLGLSRQQVRTREKRLRARIYDTLCASGYLDDLVEPDGALLARSTTLALLLVSLLSPASSSHPDGADDSAHFQCSFGDRHVLE